MLSPRLSLFVFLWESPLTLKTYINIGKIGVVCLWNERTELLEINSIFTNATIISLVFS